MQFKKKESTYILDGNISSLTGIILKMLTLKCVKHISDIVSFQLHCFKLDIFKIPLYLFRIADAQVGLKCTKMLLEESKCGTVVH